jgi:hypothetical protein
MTAYYINKEPDENGGHVIHRTHCEFMPHLRTRAFLGNYDSCKEAVEIAKKIYDNISICTNCCETDFFEEDYEGTEENEGELEE